MEEIMGHASLLITTKLNGQLSGVLLSIELLNKVVSIKLAPGSVSTDYTGLASDPILSDILFVNFHTESISQDSAVVK